MEGLALRGLTVFAAVLVKDDLEMEILDECEAVLILPFHNAAELVQAGLRQAKMAEYPTLKHDLPVAAHARTFGEHMILWVSAAVLSEENEDHHLQLRWERGPGSHCEYVCPSS